jgi:hypothetical protein
MDFNQAGEEFDLIPSGTIVTLHVTVRPGGAGEGGWLKRSKDGSSEALDCEFKAVDGLYAKRKLWDLLLVKGTTDGHEIAADITRRRLRAILESARGFKDESSEAAVQARRITSWAEFDGLRFIARVGVEPASNGYRAKNNLIEVITPDRVGWHQVEQVPPSPKPAPTSPSTAAAAPANSNPPVIARPKWAE